MLHGTCLSEALQAWYDNLAINTNKSDDKDDVDEFGGPDGNGEDGRDLDLDDEDNNNNHNGSPHPVDGPPIFSEVDLTHKKGAYSLAREDPL